MRTLSLCSIMLIAASAVAQQKATTQDGREVLLNPDGTWQYLVSPVAKSAEDKGVLPATQLNPSKAEAPPAEAIALEPANAGTPSGKKTATGKNIYVGPRGGHYHYSASGRKVYERRRK